MAAAKDETALAVYEPGALQVSEEMQEAFEVALTEGETLGPNDLPSVRPPAGGSPFFTLWDGKPAETFTAVVFHHDRTRSYWAQGYEEGEGNSPPDCASFGAIYGVGVMGVGSEENPTGECGTCPMGQFTEENGKRLPPACAERVRAFMAVPGVALPVVLSIPPSGLTNFRKSVRDMSMARGRPYYNWPVKFGSEEVQGVVKYHRITATMLTDALPPETAAVVKAIRADWVPRLAAATVEIGEIR